MKKIVFGKNSVLEAIEYEFPIEEIYLQKGLVNNNLKFKKVVYLDRNSLDKLTENGNHQGYAAKLKDFQYHDLGSIFKDGSDKVLILDHIQDPQNFGAIIRSANVFGFKHIIIPKDRACDVTPSVLKTSSGGFKNVKVIKVNSLFDAIEELKNKGFWIYASALNQQAKKLNDAKFNEKIAIIVGNEGSGVSKTSLKHSDEIIYIEQDKESVQSLNVSVATGILLYTVFNKK